MIDLYIDIDNMISIHVGARISEETIGPQDIASIEVFNSWMPTVH